MLVPALLLAISLGSPAGDPTKVVAEKPPKARGWSATNPTKAYWEK